VTAQPVANIRSIEFADSLLMRVASGDHGAFGELYDLICARLHGVIRRCLIDPAQSEEVTQDVFLEIWQNAARYEPESGGAVGWMMTIAHRRAVDRVRSSQASRDRDIRIGIRDTPRDFDHVAEAGEISIEHERARRALAAISELQREVVMLAYFDGLSQTEIAAQLGVKIGTVKTRLRDGLIRLRAEMTTAE
jgi:RNA polymerase sigma-70 factor, ECF subfamily